MHCAGVVLPAVLLATVAASMRIPHSDLQYRQNSIDSDDSESRGIKLLGNTGRMHDYGINVRGRPENTPGGNSLTDRVQEPLVKKNEFVYNGDKDFSRQVSSSDESAGSDDEFDEESKELRQGLFPTRTMSDTVPDSASEDDSTASSWTKHKIPFLKSRLDDYDNNIAADASSESNARRTTGAEEPEMGISNFIDTGDDGDGYQLLGERSSKQDVDWPTGGNFGRVRRGVFSVPGIKTIPEVLDMGRGRCRHPPHRLDRGRVHCRPVW